VDFAWQPRYYDTISQDKKSLEIEVEEVIKRVKKWAN